MIVTPFIRIIGQKCVKLNWWISCAPFNDRSKLSL